MMPDMKFLADVAISSSYKTIALSRGIELERVYRRVGSQRKHIRRLQERIKADAKTLKDYADWTSNHERRIAAMMAQMEKMAQHTAYLRSRNMELEALNLGRNPDAPPKV